MYYIISVIILILLFIVVKKNREYDIKGFFLLLLIGILGSIYLGNLQHKGFLYKQFNLIEYQEIYFDYFNILMMIIIITIGLYYSFISSKKQ